MAAAEGAGDLAHVILFSPKPELRDAERRDLLDSLVAASAEIPSIRTFRVGRRMTTGFPDTSS